MLGEVLDDGLGSNQAKSLEVISADDQFGVFQAPLLATGFADLDDAGIPTYNWGIHATEAANRNHIFPSTVIQCADCTGRGVRTWPSWQASRRSRPSATATPTTRRRAPMASAVRRPLRRRHGHRERVLQRRADLPGFKGSVGTVVTAMKQAGVEVVATCMDLNGMKTLAEELHRQGMDDVVLLHPNTYNQQFVADAGDLFEGDYVSVQYRPYEAESEGTSLEDYLSGWRRRTAS